MTDRGHEAADNRIDGRLDPSSVPGHPDYMDRDDFLRQHNLTGEVSQAGPSSRMLVSYFDVANSERKAVDAQGTAVGAAVAMAVGLSVKCLVDALPAEPDWEVVQQLGAQSGASMLVFGGVSMLVATIRMNQHRNKTNRLRQEFEQ